MLLFTMHRREHGTQYSLKEKQKTIVKESLRECPGQPPSRTVMDVLYVGTGAEKDALVRKWMTTGWECRENRP